MLPIFENHEIPYNLRCGSAKKLPGTNATDLLKFRGAMFWNVIPKNIKLSKTRI